MLHKPEILMVGTERFPRCVIVDGNAREEPLFWTGRIWTTELQRAMLFADENTLQNELTTIACRR